MFSVLSLLYFPNLAINFAAPWKSSEHKYLIHSEVGSEVIVLVAVGLHPLLKVAHLDRGENICLSIGKIFALWHWRTWASKLLISSRCLEDSSTCTQQTSAVQIFADKVSTPRPRHVNICLVSQSHSESCAAAARDGGWEIRTCLHMLAMCELIISKF